MRKSTKFYLIVFFISFALTAATAGALVLTGTLTHRESHETIVILGARYTSIVLNTSLSQVSVEPNDGGETTVTIDLYAWREAEFHATDHVRVAVENGALVLTELPFPMDFLGFFPQPYAMNILLSVPPDVYETYQKEAQP